MAAPVESHSGYPARTPYHPLELKRGYLVTYLYDIDPFVYALRANPGRQRP